MATYMLIVIVFHCLTQRRVWGQMDRNFVSFLKSVTLSLLVAFGMALIKITGASIATVLSTVLHLLLGIVVCLANLVQSVCQISRSSLAWYIAWLQFTVRLTGIPDSTACSYILYLLQEMWLTGNASTSSPKNTSSSSGSSTKKKKRPAGGGRHYKKRSLEKRKINRQRRRQRRKEEQLRRQGYRYNPLFFPIFVKTPTGVHKTFYVTMLTTVTQLCADIGLVVDLSTPYWMNHGASPIPTTGSSNVTLRDLNVHQGSIIELYYCVLGGNSDDDEEDSKDDKEPEEGDSEEKRSDEADEGFTKLVRCIYSSYL